VYRFLFQAKMRAIPSISLLLFCLALWCGAFADTGADSTPAKWVPPKTARALGTVFFFVLFAYRF
jgi:protein-S-isoprenylcysteine O-methyltransferase Ste14